ncbi:MAG: ribosome biogenesis GTPase Der [Acidobacteriota bacterium]
MYRVAIIGRPNVGKSTLFNRLIGQRKAIVGDEPGITRDRLFEVARSEGKCFEVIDTGGLVPENKELIPEMIMQQAEIAMEEADLILFVVDVRSGVHHLDESLNALLRSRGRDFLLVVNKVDVPQVESEMGPFYAFGVASPYPISAEHNLGISMLMERILEDVPEGDEPGEQEEIRVTILGRPNVGKSSLLNRFLGHERVIVTDLPGTTRDSIDSLLKVGDQAYRLIDTAGIRRKGKTKLETEKLCVVMARKNLKRADVVLLLIDATEGATHLDAAIGGYAHEEGKSIIIVVNKWDLVARDTYTAIRLEEEFRLQMKFLEYAPMIFVSAKTGQRVTKILGLVQNAYQARMMRFPTGELNRFLASEAKPALASRGSKRGFPVKYMVQVKVAPPTFVCFMRSSRKLHFSTQRFLINRLREKYKFFATPVRLLQRTNRKQS